MSEKLVYDKVVDPEVLAEAIDLRTSLRGTYVGIKTRYPSASDENQDTFVEIRFNRSLTSAEKDEITNIINALGPTYDLQIRKKIERETATWAMIQGHTVLRQFVANNLFRQKTHEQIRSLLDEKCLLITSLMTGSLTIAYTEVLSLVPDEKFSQNEIDEFKLRLEILLGM